MMPPFAVYAMSEASPLHSPRHLRTRFAKHKQIRHLMVSPDLHRVAEASLLCSTSLARIELT